jgi:hypothetical protein
MLCGLLLSSALKKNLAKSKERERFIPGSDGNMAAMMVSARIHDGILIER